MDHNSERSTLGPWVTSDFLRVDDEHSVGCEFGTMHMLFVLIFDQVRHCKPQSTLENTLKQMAENDKRWLWILNEKLITGLVSVASPRRGKYSWTRDRIMIIKNVLGLASLVSKFLLCISSDVTTMVWIYLPGRVWFHKVASLKCRFLRSDQFQINCHGLSILHISSENINKGRHLK